MVGRSVTDTSFVVFLLCSTGCRATVEYTGPGLFSKGSDEPYTLQSTSISVSMLVAVQRLAGLEGRRFSSSRGVILYFTGVYVAHYGLCAVVRTKWPVRDHVEARESHEFLIPMIQPGDASDLCYRISDIRPIGFDKPTSAEYKKAWRLLSVLPENPAHRDREPV